MSEQQDQPKPKKGKLTKRLMALMMFAIIGLVLSIALMGGGDEVERAEYRQAPEAVSQSGVRVVELTPPRLGGLPGHEGVGITGSYQACIVCHGGIFNGR